MAAPKRSKLELSEDRRIIAAAYLRGVFQADIAAQLNAREGIAYTITRQTIGNDLKVIRKAWLASAVRDFDERQSQELAKVDELEATYWAAYDRSCEDVVTKKTYGKVTKDGDFTRTRPADIITKGQVGDPRFLQGVQWCIKRRCEIMGLDAPTRLEHSGDGMVTLRVVYDEEEKQGNE